MTSHLRCISDSVISPQFIKKSFLLRHSLYRLNDAKNSEAGYNTMLRQDFLEGMSRAACTVSIVTTDGPGGKAGVTVSAMTSVSADATSPALLVCIHHMSAVAKAIQENGVFCVNVLRDEQAPISDVFAGRVKLPSGDKFECADWRCLKTGAPSLSRPLVAFDCTLQMHFRYGSHFVFIGEVAHIVVEEPGAPLVYANRAYGMPIANEHVRAKSIVSLGADASESELEIGAYSTLGASFLPAVLAGFKFTHTAVRISLLEADQDRLKAALDKGEIETAFTYDLELEDRFDRILLGEIPPYVLLPDAHPLCARSEVSLRQLASEPMVLLDAPPSRDYFQSLFAEVGCTPNIAHRSRSFEMVRSMVGHGFGYALLATKPSNNITYDGLPLTTRPLKEKVQPSRFVLCHKNGRELSPNAVSFTNYCRAFFGEGRMPAAAD